MGVLAWLRPKNAPTVELGAQLEATTAELEAATAALKVAQAEFDDRGTDRASKALLAAKETKALAEQHVDRATRLLAEAKERDEEARLAQLRSVLDSKREALAEVLATEEPLLDEEADLLRRVLDVRTRRWQIRTAASQLVQDVHRAHYALHETWDEETHVKLEPSGAPIVARLEQTQLQLRAKSRGTDPRRSMLRALCPKPDDYWMAANRRAIPEQMIPFADLLPVVDDGGPGDAA